MENSRRDFIRNGTLMGLGAFAATQSGWGMVSGFLNEKPVFKLPDLPYGVNALEPYIDATTMEIHHGKHHAAYVKNLNAAIEKESSFPATLEEAFRNISKYNDTIRNNGGGHWNHSFFWRMLRSPRPGSAPQGALATAINESFGSLDSFKDQFKAQALGRFGSGWAWLVKDSKGKLRITTTANQDNPLMEKKGGSPILAIDVWEHAYYLKYQNKRADYIDGFWNVVNWEFAGDAYIM